MPSLSRILVPRALHHESAIRRAWALVDASVWFAAVILASWFRSLYVIENPVWLGALVGGALAAGLHLALAPWTGPYRRGQLRGSYEEIVALAQIGLVVVLMLIVFALVGDSYRLVPGTVAVIAGLVALTEMLALRVVVRAVRSRRRIHSSAEPIVVFGAGHAGRLLVHALLNDVASPYRPVAVLDDDPGKRGLRIEGIKVSGGRRLLAQAGATWGVTKVVVAMPSADSAVMRELAAAADRAGLRTLVVPPLGTLLHRPLRGSDLRDIDLEDLLGRRAVTLDEAAIADQLAGKVVLVTGAGGSIGAELCRQIKKFGAERLVMVDRDESALHSVTLDLEGHGLLDSEDIVLADIRDPHTLHDVFARHRPQVVFHAAALKHLPLLQRYPMEAWQTNVIGTRNVLDAAAATRVETFVNISTDKAADPTSVLGYSKRIAERLTAGFSDTHPGRFLSVRFGNVLGSRGSVIPAFTRQIQRGGPVTVTHPDVERYFMLIPEACQLVLQSASLGRGGEVMVLDMGSPVKIKDVAQALIDIAGGDDVQIHYTGLRPGEKMSENLFAQSDGQLPTEHELVSFVHVPALAPAEVPTGPPIERVATLLRTYAGGPTSTPHDRPRDPWPSVADALLTTASTGSTTSATHHKPSTTERLRDSRKTAHVAARG